MPLGIYLKWYKCWGTVRRAMEIQTPPKYSGQYNKFCNRTHCFLVLWFQASLSQYTKKIKMGLGIICILAIKKNLKIGWNTSGTHYFL